MSSRSSVSRRQVRETIVQLLYSGDPKGLLPDPDDAPVLDLLLEPWREKVTRARAKALVHLQQGRPKAAARLPDLIRELSLVEQGGDHGALPHALRDLAEAEEQIADGLEHVRIELNGNKSASRLAELLEDCRQANIRSRAAAARIASAAPDFPALQQLRLTAIDLWAGLLPQADLLQSALARDPRSSPELAAVTQAERDVATVAERLTNCLTGLAAQLPAIDETIAQAVENYAPERIDRVDRAVLRLATYEILFDPDIPPGVAINEGIELARSFGTSDSPRFVNGILDRIRKSAPSESQPNL